MDSKPSLAKRISHQLTLSFYTCHQRERKRTPSPMSRTHSERHIEREISSPKNFMTKNLRTKINDFIFSEEGRVGVKSPLTLGFVGGGMLLAQAILPSPTEAHLVCWYDYECASDEVCHYWCEESVGTCTGIWHSECMDPDEIDD